jgi:hypothetical protein
VEHGIKKYLSFIEIALLVHLCPDQRVKNVVKANPRSEYANGIQPLP